jgi:hypothetical protein
MESYAKSFTFKSHMGVYGIKFEKAFSEKTDVSVSFLRVYIQ